MLHQTVKFPNGVNGLIAHQNVTLDQSNRCLLFLKLLVKLKTKLCDFVGQETGGTPTQKEVQIVLWTCMKSNHAEVMKLIVHHQENPMEHQLYCLLPPTWEWGVTLMMAMKKKTQLAKHLTGVHGVLVARNVDQVFREGQGCI